MEILCFIFEILILGSRTFVKCLYIVLDIFLSPFVFIINLFKKYKIRYFHLSQSYEDYFNNMPEEAAASRYEKKIEAKAVERKEK